MSFEHAVALTGSIATGKSTSSKIFSGLGFEIIDADSIAHMILDRESAKVAELFGEEYLTDSNRVDRVALGRLVFGDNTKRKILEELLHPLIRKEITSQAEVLDSSGVTYLIDLPLFFESGSSYPIESSIVVYSPREIQLQRLIDREGYSVEEAESRISSQIDIEKKRAEATYIVDNSGDLKQLENECNRVAKLLR